MKETRRHGLTFSVMSVILTAEKQLAEPAGLEKFWERKWQVQGYLRQIALSSSPGL